MRVSLIITTFNRPEYLSRCFQSLKAADLSGLDSIIIVDDGSTDPDTRKLINEFSYEGANILRVLKNHNSGIKNSLILGYSMAFPQADIVMNLDGDAIVRADFVSKLIALKKQFPDNIVSGFNTTVLNRNPIISEHDGYYKKKYCSGINMVINKEEFEKYLSPSLKEPHNWDFETSKKHLADGKEVIVSKPSLLQHIGIRSSLGHGVTELPDIAEDFYLHDLSTVTLIGASCNDLPWLIRAADISTKYLKFGAVKLLSSQLSNDSRVISINPLRSKADYNQFVLKQMVNYVRTPFFLIIQPDGYVVNPHAWTNDFLSFDFIGAPWEWYMDGLQIGNGGMSLRSRRLHEIVRDDNHIQPVNDHLIKNYEEDHNIGRIYRHYLESKYQIKYSSVDLARRFSIEAYGVKPPRNKYDGSFGFHGWNVDWSDAKLEHIPNKYPL